MKSINIVGCLLAAGLAATAFGQAAETARAQFIDREGRQVGNAILSQTPNGVLIAVEVSGIPPGEHAFHVHEKGQCNAKRGFESAGGHLAPGGRPHGLHDKAGPHAGDMPNQFVGPDGVLRAHVVNARVALEDFRIGLLDADGSALVIHAGPDDYRSQPSGNAGERIACAVIRRG